MLRYGRNLKSTARKLRSTMTDSEKVLWSKLGLKQLGKVQFYRQKPLGEFIVDFYTPKAKLVVEVDGGQHSTAEGLAADLRRERYLSGLGLKVLRFDNFQVLKHTDSVLLAILQFQEGL